MDAAHVAPAAAGSPRATRPLWAATRTDERTSSNGLRTVSTRVTRTPERSGTGQRTAAPDRSAHGRGGACSWRSRMRPPGPVRCLGTPDLTLRAGPRPQPLSHEGNGRRRPGSETRTVTVAQTRVRAPSATTIDIGCPNAPTSAGTRRTSRTWPRSHAARTSRPLMTTSFREATPPRRPPPRRPGEGRAPLCP